MGEGTGAHYWLTPFKTFRADCPYFIGGYAEAADMVNRLLSAGVDTFIIDLPADETEYAHCRAAFDLCRESKETGV